MGRVFSNVVCDAVGHDATSDIPTVAGITFSNGPLRMVYKKTRLANLSKWKGVPKERRLSICAFSAPIIFRT